jgi:hypothetical protein
MSREDLIKIKETATQFFAENTVDSEDQSKISLFIMGLKTINTTILSKIGFEKIEWIPYTFLHNQYFKEIELTTLLQKGTSWSMNPMLYFDATQRNASIWEKAKVNKYLTGFFALDQTFYQYLALSHAIMSEVRFIPLISPDTDFEKSHFWSTIYSIEVENGRQIQTQIRMLKDIDVPLSEKEKNDIVMEQRGIILNHFLTFLKEICHIKT